MEKFDRRHFIKFAATAGVGALLASCTDSKQHNKGKNMVNAQRTAQNVILGMATLGFQWQTKDPFLFCVHHDDAYPKGNTHMGPEASLQGRQMGNDFAGIDGWRMYHGDIVPGFPQHPHRGFETVTIVRKGLVDHSDSLGATARYGNGDVQWLTAGKGIQHAEMFPLVNQDKDNPLELFQIWLNLPKSHKMVNPYFSMFWSNRIPKLTIKDISDRPIELGIIAGSYQNTLAPSPPPDSWASQKHSDIAIWTMKLSPHAEFVLPKASKDANRVLYFFEGKELNLHGTTIAVNHQVDVVPSEELLLVNGSKESEILMLQGKPIGEAVAQYGPFVMNTQEEIAQAFYDYRQTQFGGWPWPNTDPVHPREKGRFAKHISGLFEEPA